MAFAPRVETGTELHQRYVVDYAPYMVAMVVGSEFKVLRSHVVEDTDALAQEWARYLSDLCYLEQHSEMFSAEDWMMGGGMYTQGRIFQTCPGASTDHNCKYDRAKVSVDIPQQGTHDRATEGRAQISQSDQGV